MNYGVIEQCMAVGIKFDRFLSNIELTTDQFNDAATKHTGVRKALHVAFYSTADDGSTSFLVGSYGKRTATRPPSDVDIMFVLPPSYFNRYNALQGNKQSRLLQDIKGILRSSYPSTDLRGDGQVVMVPFVTFAIEVAPCFLLQNGRYFICDTNGGGNWKETAPQEEMNALTSANARTNGNTVRLIKMMKVWKRYCDVPIKSLAVELMVQDFLGGYAYADKPSVYYDWMVRDFLAYMTQRANYIYYLPGTNEPVRVGNNWLSRAESAFSRAAKACDYERDSQDEAANEEWRKIFGGFFIG